MASPRAGANWRAQSLGQLLPSLSHRDTSRLSFGFWIQLDPVLLFRFSPRDLRRTGPLTLKLTGPTRRGQPRMELRVGKEHKCTPGAWSYCIFLRTVHYSFLNERLVAQRQKPNREWLRGQSCEDSPLRSNHGTDVDLWDRRQQLLQTLSALHSLLSWRHEANSSNLSQY